MPIDLFAGEDTSTPEQWHVKYRTRRNLKVAGVNQEQ
jgi:hypothetical protein